MDYATPGGAVSQAKEILRQLGALHENKITPHGKEMLRLPTHPRIAHMLLEASAFDLFQGSQQNSNSLLALATDIAATLEERDPLNKDAGADLSLRIETLRKWRSGERVSADRNILERIERLASSWRKIFRINQDNTIQSIQMLVNCWQKLIPSVSRDNLKNLVRDTNLFMVASLNFLITMH